MLISKLTRQVLAFVALISIPYVATGQEENAASSTTPAPELIKQKKSKFKELYTVQGLSLRRYKNIVPASEGIKYKVVRSGIYPGQTEFELAPEEKEQLERAFGGLFVRELMNWNRFPLVETPEPDSIYLKVSMSEVLSFVPPPHARRNNEIKKILSGNLNIELFDLSTGHVIMKAGDRVLIKDLYGVKYEDFIWSHEAVQKQFSRWGASLKAELQRFEK